jgi:hypothetical protein
MFSENVHQVFFVLKGDNNMEPCASYCLEFEEDVHEKVKNLALFLMVAEFSSRMRGGKKKKKRARCLRKPKV